MNTVYYFPSFKTSEISVHAIPVITFLHSLKGALVDHINMASFKVRTQLGGRGQPGLRRLHVRVRLLSPRRGHHPFQRRRHLQDENRESPITADISRNRVAQFGSRRESHWRIDHVD